MGDKRISHPLLDRPYLYCCGYRFLPDRHKKLFSKCTYPDRWLLSFDAILAVYQEMVGEEIFRKKISLLHN